MKLCPADAFLEILLAEIRRVDDVAKFLVETGLLFEINRQVLHPLGLAMEVVDNGDGSFEIGSIWDCRNDLEGIIYEPKTFQEGVDKVAKYMEDRGHESHQSRLKKLGYLVQRGS